MPKRKEYLRNPYYECGYPVVTSESKKSYKPPQPKPQGEASYLDMVRETCDDFSEVLAI